ncbi:unnamed protein product [Mesocestoides corti]|uniref:Uncharacterized protein n=1 Tax=Mesocestoides corti TaxID=53468 RepID=A0A0R3UJ35_MESCO|nr:unnamed protein product [Mesocestoides corti]
MCRGDANEWHASTAGALAVWGVCRLGPSELWNADDLNNWSLYSSAILFEFYELYNTNKSISIRLWLFKVISTDVYRNEGSYEWCWNNYMHEMSGFSKST